MQRSKLQFKIIFLAILAIFTLLPLAAFAAELRIDAKDTEVAVGQQFHVNILLDAENEEINAVEGEIMFPNDRVEPKEIRDENSIISFWVERPKIAEKSKISFSGIIPGGYKATKGLIFSLLFLAKKEGRVGVTIHDVRALKNDGLGTPASVAVSDFLFSISAHPEVASQEPVKVKDNDPPENFTPEISQAKDMFDGKYFLVFATQDKGSGLDHYEVREGFWARFISAESPHLLQSQKLDKKIFVKAIDKSGNERIAVLEPRYPITWYENYENWIMIIVVLLIIAFAARKFVFKR